MSWMSEVAQESMAESITKKLETEIQRVQNYHHYNEGEKKAYLDALRVARKIAEDSVSY